MQDPVLPPIRSQHRTRSRSAVAALALLWGVVLGAAPAHADDDNRAPAVPPILQVPAGNKLALHARGVGVQIYVCTQSATDPTQFSWVFKAPDAILYEADDDEIIGLHYAGPTWEDEDGKVVGAVLQRSPSPDPGAIPWLLLQAVSNAGHGVFARTTFIQRLNTVGGVAPTTGADAAHVGQEVRVPYTADYYFYRARRP
jgi:hypothetical protein